MIYGDDGLTVDRYSDILETLIALAEEWKGSSLDTGERHLIGHMFRNEALLHGESNEIIQQIYDHFSVSNSAGAHLDNLVELIGLTRQDQAKSTVTLTCTVSDATTIPAGSLIKTESNLKFETDVDLVFTVAGSDDVAATCTVYGANDAAIGEIDTIVTPVYAWQSVTNAAAAIPGRDREVDSELKARHTAAVATSGERDAASIYEAVAAVDGVSYAMVNEDYTSSTPVSVYVVGGLDANIAAAIDNSITAGIGMYGTTTVSVYDTTLGQAKDISFTRATEVPIYLTCTISVNPAIYPTTGDDDIKDALVGYIGGTDTDGDAVVGSLGIGNDVQYWSLPQYINSPGGVAIQSLYIGTTASPTGNSDISIANYQLAQIDATNITVNKS